LSGSEIENAHALNGAVEGALVGWHAAESLIFEADFFFEKSDFSFGIIKLGLEASKPGAAVAARLRAYVKTAEAREIA